MSDKLKPCPFCAWAAKVYTRWSDCGGKPWYEIECTNPDCGGGVGDTADEAEKSWNTRHPAAEVRALVEAAAEVPRRYRKELVALYRERGVVPAAKQYQEMISAIVRLEAALAALEENV